MKNNILKLAILVLLITTLSTPFLSFAESGATEQDINVELNPQNPIPGDIETATLTSFVIDLNKAFIKWQDKNGNVLSSGNGDTSYTMTVGAPNSLININVSVTPSGDSAAITKQFTVSPSNVDILWEASDVYTPPFYKGKSLPTSESTIKAVAMLNSGTLSGAKNNTVYLWKLDHNSINDASGYGKDFFNFKNSYLRNTEQIDVNVSPLNNSYSSSTNVSIPIDSAKILFYLKGADGVINYEQALNGSNKIPSDESTIVAEPYFFLLDSKNGDTTFDWKINNNSIPTQNNPLSQTFRPESSGGYATITLTLESISRLFQKVSSTLKLNL